jgi:nucleoside-diphosphate-sugar epimerase
VSELLTQGFKVHAVAHRSGVPAEVSGADITHCNLLDAGAVDALIARVAPTHLLHLAWIATPGSYWQSPDNELWRDASRHLIERFVSGGGKRVVVSGTCAEYEWSTAGVCVEKRTPLADVQNLGLSRYARSKLELAKFLEQLSDRTGLSYAWGRVFFQFGPYENPQRLVASVVCNLLRDRVAECTSGRQVRSFLHVADVGHAFARLLHVDVHGPVNIGSDERISVADLVQRLADKLQRRGLVRLGARQGPPEPALLVPDTRRLALEVGWQPRYSLDGALDDTIRWWRTQLDDAT